MMYTQIRNYLEIATILKNNYIQIDEFITRFKLSKYEYKSDLCTIYEMQEYYGIEFIINEQDNTLFYRVTDVDQFSFIYPIFNELYFRYQNARILSKRLIINCIVSWTLLDSTSPISTTEIADNLGYSRSGLRFPLKWARDHIEHYNLNYTNIPHYGIQIKGNEFYKRMCLIALNNFIDPRIIIDLDQNLIYNHANDSLINKIDTLINKILDFNGMSISYINIRLLSHYLIIQYNRIAKNYVIETIFEKSDEIINTFEYYCAKVILDELYPNIEISISEYIYLAILIITINESSDYQHLNYLNYSQSFENKTNEIVKDICDLLKDNYGLIFDNSIYLDALRKTVNRIVLKQQFKMNTFKGFSLSGKSYAATKKPLMLMIRKDILELLYNKYNIFSQKSNVIDLIDIIQRYIQSQKIFFPKKKIYIMTHSSILDSLLIKEAILSKFPSNFFESIEIKNDPKIINTLSNDIIYITNYFSNLKRGKNVYILDKNKNDINDLKEFLIINNHLSCYHINSVTSEYINSNNLSSIFDITKCKYAIKNNILFILNCNQLGKANLSLYMLSTKINLFENQEIERIVYIELNFNNDNIRYYDYILTLFMIEPTFFDELFTKPNLDTLDTFLNKLNIN